MSLEDAIAVIDKYPAEYVQPYMLGESLLYPSEDFKTVCEYIKSKDSQLVLYTNGMLPIPEDIPFDKVVFSVDGISQKGAVLTRVGSDFSKIEKNIIDYDGYKVIRVAVSDHNRNYKDVIKDYWSPIPVAFVEIWDYDKDYPQEDTKCWRQQKHLAVGSDLTGYPCCGPVGFKTPLGNVLENDAVKIKEGLDWNSLCSVCAIRDDNERI